MEFLSWHLLEQCLGVTLHTNSLEFALNVSTCIYTVSMCRKVKTNYIKVNTAYFGPHTMEHLRICWNIDLKHHFVGSGLERCSYGIVLYLGGGCVKRGGWVGGWVIQWKLASCMACLKSAYVYTKNDRKDRQDGALFAMSGLGSGECRPMSAAALARRLSVDVRALPPTSETCCIRTLRSPDAACLWRDEAITRA
jgi:hypothetical protein